LRGGLTGTRSSDLAEDVTTDGQRGHGMLAALIDPIMPQDNFWYMLRPCDQENRRSTLLWAMRPTYPQKQYGQMHRSRDSLQHQQPLLKHMNLELPANIRMWNVGMFSVRVIESSGLRMGIDTKSSMSSNQQIAPRRWCLPDFVPTRPHSRGVRRMSSSMNRI
jgi:hypothetical protein